MTREKADVALAVATATYIAVTNALGVALEASEILEDLANDSSPEVRDCLEEILDAASRY